MRGQPLAFLASLSRPIGAVLAALGLVSVAVPTVLQSAVAAAATPQGGSYIPFDPPVRVCDTRPGRPSGQCSGRTIAAGTSLTVSLADFIVHNPFGAVTAVVINVTAVHPAGSGYLTVYPSGSSLPNTPNLNVKPGVTVSTLAEVGVGEAPDLDISIYASIRSDVLVDLQGYFFPGNGFGLYHPLASPLRICDTRTYNPSHLFGAAAQCNSHPVAAGRHLAVSVAHRGFGVPAGAVAVVANVTAVSPTDPGYLTVYPDDLSRPPLTSNVNYTKSQVNPNRVIATLPADGKVDVYSSQTTNVIVDISGYYSDTGGKGGIFARGPSPERICDTRANNPSGLFGAAAQCNGPANQGRALGPGASLKVQVSGQFGVPRAASVALVNITAVKPTRNTYLTVFSGRGQPVTADLDPAAGAVETNLVVGSLSSSGALTIYNRAGTINVAVDLIGWYEVAPQAPNAPVALSATPGDSQIALTWTAPPPNGSPIDGYQVFEREGAFLSPVNDSLINTTNYTVTGLTDGTTYNFVVAAINTLGESPFSNQASATPEPASPSGSTTGLQ
jgi:hypothetical protein